MLHREFHKRQDDTELKTSMERMYRAGNVLIPDQEEKVVTTVEHLADCIARIDTESAQMGDPSILRGMLRVGGDVDEGLRRAATCLQHASSAMIRTAEDFRATDAQAAADYRHLGRGLRTPGPMYSTPPSIGDPEKPGADSLDFGPDLHGKERTTHHHIPSTRAPQDDRKTDEHRREERESQAQADERVEEQVG